MHSIPASQTGGRPDAIEPDITCATGIHTLCLQAAELAAVEAAKEAAVTEVDEWCQGEVEAVRVTLGRRLEEAQAAAREWWVPAHC